MAILVQNKVVAQSFRASRSPYEIQFLPELSLGEAYQALTQQGAREESLFLLQLTVKSPLLNDATQEAVNRFLGCQNTTLLPGDGDPLLYCAISDAIAVGCPSIPEWDCGEVTVTFDEIFLDGAIEERWETIDSLTRSDHAQPICSRHRARIRDGLLETISRANLWDGRLRAFPNLVFGPDVESHLENVNTGHLSTIANKLASLDDSVANWLCDGSLAPEWRSKVTDETESVKTNPALREARRFRSNNGNSELFFWHARFGASGRIHLRVDASSHLVEIGYVGQHLLLR